MTSILLFCYSSTKSIDLMLDMAIGSKGSWIIHDLRTKHHFYQTLLQTIPLIIVQGKTKFWILRYKGILMRLSKFHETLTYICIFIYTNQVTFSTNRYGCYCVCTTCTIKQEGWIYQWLVLTEDLNRECKPRLQTGSNRQEVTDRKWMFPVQPMHCVM